MRKLIILFFIMSVSITTYSQNELKYNPKSEEIPKWAVLMYQEDTDEGAVIDAYREYYKIYPFIKNKHTQYYKRWIRNLSRTSKNIQSHQKSKKSNQWECVGPWDFDQHAESRSYAPGAAHVYTVEQSKSNPNILYAGTATAGAWRTNDKGLNWHLLTKELPLSTVYALEIDFTNEDVIYISGNGSLYKSIDGGVNWNIIGDTTFTNLSHSIKDIKLKPNNNTELFVASNNGLYHSLNSGITFTEIMTGNFLEIEFHPNSSDTIYFVKQSGDSTLFYRSDDGGNNLTLFSNG